MIDTLDSKRVFLRDLAEFACLSGFSRVALWEPSSCVATQSKLGEGARCGSNRGARAAAPRGRDHVPHAGRIHGPRDARRRAASSSAGQPPRRGRGGTTRDTGAPGRTRAVGRGAPWEEALEAA